MSKPLGKRLGLHRPIGLLGVVACTVLIWGCADETEAPRPSSEEATPPQQASDMSLKQRLPRNLGPRAKKALMLRRNDDKQISFLVEISPRSDINTLSKALTGLGAEISAYSEIANIITVEATNADITNIAKLEGVVYLELAQDYNH